MIRQGITSDEMAIRECAEQAYAHYVLLIGRKPAPMVADFAGQIAAGNVYVATDDQGEFCGFIVFYAQDAQMLLENVAVLPAASGRGIGRELIGFCEDTALQCGLKAVCLYTNEKMSDNLSIYPKLGYAEVGRHMEDGFNRVYFKKSLA